MTNPNAIFKKQTHTKIVRLAMSLGLFLCLANLAMAQTTTTFDFTSTTFAEAHGMKGGSNMPSSVSEGDITITFGTTLSENVGYYDQDDMRYVTLYDGVYMTLTAQDYPIESVALTFAEGSTDLHMPTESTWTTSSGTYDYAAHTWAGAATSVAFSCLKGAGTLGLQKIVVTTSATAVEKETPTLSFASENYTLTLGEAFTSPTVSGVPDGASVAYTSSNTDVATVDASTGEVTGISAGTTFITATSSSTSTHNAGTAQYLLEVKASATGRIGNIYKKVTSQSDIRDGGIYLVASTITVYGTPTTYALTRQTSETWAGAPVTRTGTTIDTKVNGSSQPEEIVLEEISAGVYALRLSTGAYLTNAATTTSQVKISTTTATDVSQLGLKAQWSVQYSNGAVNILNKYTAKKERALRMNDAGNFSAYPKGEKNALTLYQRVEDVAIKTREGYGTLYADKAILLPEGLEATTITGVEGTGRPTTPWQYSAASLVPAHTGLLLRGTYGTTYTCPLLDKTLDAATDNALYGTTTATQPAADSDAYFYYLTYSKEDGVKTLGFYWLAQGGTPVVNTPYRAYLKLPKTESTASTKGFALSGDAATAIPTPTYATSASPSIYTLSGHRVGTAPNRLPAGLYIIGGKKVLVR